MTVLPTEKDRRRLQISLCFVKWAWAHREKGMTDISTFTE